MTVIVTRVSAPVGPAKSQFFRSIIPPGAGRHWLLSIGDAAIAFRNRLIVDGSGHTKGFARDRFSLECAGAT
jgi:hypothetical protein